MVRPGGRLAVHGAHGVYCLGARPQPPISAPQSRPLLLLTLLASLLFAVLVLIGANPKADIQTALIVRPVFAPSFAMLAILIGLGLFILLDGLGEREVWRGRNDRLADDIRQRGVNAPRNISGS